MRPYPAPTRNRDAAGAKQCLCPHLLLDHSIDLARLLWMNLHRKRNLPGRQQVVPTGSIRLGLAPCFVEASATNVLRRTVDQSPVRTGKSLGANPNIGADRSAALKPGANPLESMLPASPAHSASELSAATIEFTRSLSPASCPHVFSASRSAPGSSLLISVAETASPS